MAASYALRRQKVAALTEQANQMLRVAKEANRVGDFREWRVKVLEAFVLVDLAWKIAAGNAHPDDEGKALVTFESLQATLTERIARTIKPN